MGCLLALFSLITPRFVLIVLWLFTDYIGTAISGWILPVIGFLVLPTTTIAYAVAKNDMSTASGGITFGGVVVIVIGVVLDLGLLGGASRSRR
jgi:hypothetical protein